MTKERIQNLFLLLEQLLVLLLYFILIIIVLLLPVKPVFFQSYTTLKFVLYQNNLIIITRVVENDFNKLFFTFINFIFGHGSRKLLR